jgi:SAM-dependent methyltransferase
MTFDLAWLDLREAADHSARNRDVLAAAVDYCRRLEAPLVLDLGSGTGSTVRALSHHLPPGTRWRLVDNDRRLLEAAQARHGAAVETVVADLKHLRSLPIEGVDLVVASALFDLVSMTWLEELTELLAARQCGLYSALNYNGHMAWEPALADDDRVRQCFNLHQGRDKGFGHALGPSAASALEQMCRARGYWTMRAESNWSLGAAEQALQDEFNDGVARAAADEGFERSRDWGQARRAASGSTSCTVGHEDVAALPRARAQSKTTSLPSP